MLPKNQRVIMLKINLSTFIWSQRKKKVKPDFALPSSSSPSFLCFFAFSYSITPRKQVQKMRVRCCHEFIKHTIIPYFQYNPTQRSYSLGPSKYSDAVAWKHNKTTLKMLCILHKEHMLKHLSIGRKCTCTIHGPWNWSRLMEFSHHSLFLLFTPMLFLLGRHVKSSSVKTASVLFSLQQWALMADVTYIPSINHPAMSNYNWCESQKRILILQILAATCCCECIKTSALSQLSKARVLNITHHHILGVISRKHYYKY